jgi:endo-1,4-beta-xylanase
VDFNPAGLNSRYILFAVMKSPHWLSVLLIAAASQVWGQSLQPRSGWVFVPGAQDMIQAGQWDCTTGVNASNDTLSISAASGNYNTIINTTGPILKVQGDFSVLATLSDPGSGGSFLTMVGSLNTGSQYWQGLMRLDVGRAGSAIQVNYWTGTSANPTSQTYPIPAGVTDPVTFEVARIGKQIVVYVNGTQAGSFADPGLFSSGQMFFGFNVSPGDTLKVLALAAAMPSGASTSLFALDLQVAHRTGSGLRDLATPTGLLIGAAADAPYFTDPNYVQALGGQYSLIVPENDLKFAETEPAQGQYSFCPADQLLAFAQANNMKMRGHNLVWAQDLPGWLTSGNFTSTQAADIMQDHINTVVGRYKGKLVDWDVVNEALSGSAPYGLDQTSFWYQTLGSSYLDMAFKLAHAADPNAKLFYNDYGGEGSGAKSDAIYSLVQGMISRGVPINGVGLEMHLSLDGPPSESDISANMARLGALGLEVHVSEMDVRIPVNSSGVASASDLASQATLYQNVFAACQANLNCTAFLTWGVTDLHSWIPSTFAGYGAGLLYDQQYNPKPAYNSVSANMQTQGAQTPLPAILPGGLVIHAGASAPVSPGTLADIYGTNLAAAPATTAGLPLLDTLGKVQVTVNGTPAPLYYVSPQQIDFQIPYSTSPGPALVQVTSNGTAGIEAGITVQQAAPSILTWTDSAGNVRAIAQNVAQNYVLNSSTNCAPPGTVAVVYMMGSGPLNNPITSGEGTPASPYFQETLATTATVGNEPATVQFAGLTPGFVGLMQVNVLVPQVSGEQPLQIQVGSYSSNSALLCVGQ